MRDDGWRKGELLSRRQVPRRKTKAAVAQYTVEPHCGNVPRRLFCALDLHPDVRARNFFFVGFRQIGLESRVSSGWAVRTWETESQRSLGSGICRRHHVATGSPQLESYLVVPRVQRWAAPHMGAVIQVVVARARLALLRSRAVCKLSNRREGPLFRHSRTCVLQERATFKGGRALVKGHRCLISGIIIRIALPGVAAPSREDGARLFSFSATAIASNQRVVDHRSLSLPPSNPHSCRRCVRPRNFIVGGRYGLFLLVLAGLPLLHVSQHDIKPNPPSYLYIATSTTE